MNPGMKILLAAFDFVLINIVLSLHGNISMIDVAWYMLCVGLGFGLRVAVMINNNNYSHKLLFVHGAFTVCWVFLVVLFWRTSLHKTWMNQGGNSFEIFLFLNSLFSVYMVSQFEYFFKAGFKGWIKLNVGRIFAKDVEEENA